MSGPRIRPWLAAGLLACGAGCGAAPTGERPNLVLVTVDTLRPDRLACYGGEPDVGTALCAIADAGIRYVWAFSSAPSTAPAVASILTSLYPADHGVTQIASTTLADDVLTVAEVLTENGYATAAFISNPVLRRYRNLDQGFEIYDAKMTRRERNRGLSEREAEEVTDAAVAWLRVSREPWFLWLHYQDPHGPYEPPGARPAVDGPGGTKLSALSDQSGRHGIPAYQALPGVYGVETYEARYRDEIRYLDRHLDRLVSALDENTALLLTADHGEAFGEDDYWFAHGHSVSLDQIRIPLLWRPPGGAAPSEVRTPVSNLDVAPTLLAAAGIPIPERFDGVALPTRDPEPDATAHSSGRAIFAEQAARAAVVKGRRYYGRDRVELVKPVADPVSGGRLFPQPPRGAQLPADGVLPEYEEGYGEGDELEQLLADFLESHAGAAEAGLDETKLDESEREELRALGYLE